VNTEIAQVKVGGTCTCGKGALKQARASEVGNVFDLGQKYGQDFELAYTDEKGEKQYPIMGCYGIGVSRAMGVIVEKCNDERGIVWPASVAPFQVHLVSLTSKKDDIQASISTESQKLYDGLVAVGVEVLWDDRTDASAGEKFADADLIGIPLRLVVSEKTLAQSSVEWKERSSTEAKMVATAEAVDEVKEFC
jgi:prolyl-tRNA synthetase